MPILKLKPATKDYLWGGDKLKKDFGKTSDSQILAETWELSCHKDGLSMICEGEFANISLSSYIEKNKNSLGQNCDRFDNFPILIKFIDARDRLSIQVHPDNEYGLKVEGEYGKTEMWIVVDCDEGAELIYGFKHKISKEEFAQRIENNTLLDVLNNVKVKKGDVLFIDAGTLHAIGKGIIIAEIQQNSNTTYRIYDYARRGADGKLRELHVDKALDVTERCPPKRPMGAFGEPEKFDGFTKTLLGTCEYFNVNKLEVSTKAIIEITENSFHSLLILEGEVRINMDGKTTYLKKGHCCFIPAENNVYEIYGESEIILTDIL